MACSSFNHSSNKLSTMPSSLEENNSKAEATELEHSFEEEDETHILTPAEQRSLALKLDLRLLPVIWILYFVNLLDRVAVGGASAYRFRTDLGITGNGYNVGISVFYLCYAIADIPSNLALKKFGAKYWLPFIALVYGLCSLGTAFIHNNSGFIAMRVLLGLSEAGTLPGCAYFLSTYYGREQLSLRLPLFLTASSLASGTGSLLAFAYNRIGHIVGEIHGWRNIFFINSIITFVTAIIGVIMLPLSPEKASMLTERERRFIMTRSKRLTAGVASEEGTSWKLIAQTFRNPSMYFTIVPWFVAQLISSSLTFFLPTIITQQFHYTGNKANVYISFTFFVSTAVTPILGFASDRLKHHAFFIVGVMLTGLVGLTIFAYAEQQGVRYFGVFLGQLAVFTHTGINTAWCASNSAPYTSRNVATSVSISVGALGGIAGAWVYLPKEASRGYPTGAKVTIIFSAVGALITVGHWVYCKWENKQRALGKRDHRLEGLTEKEAELLGNLHPRFVLAT
ncbi:MFS general substrate transporter [Meredithblackwellia eburnea MCA 4105]